MIIEKAAELIGSLIFDGIIAGLKVKALNIFEKFKLNRLKQNIKKWTIQNIVQDEGTILRNVKLIDFFGKENIFNEVVEFSNSTHVSMSEDKFIENLINRTKIYFDNSISNQDEIVLREFYSKLICQLSEYWLNQLPADLKAMRHYSSNEHQKILESISELPDKIQQLLISDNVYLSEKDTIALFEDFNKMFWKGNFSYLENVLPIVKNKSRMLEVWIQLSLKLVMNKPPRNVDFDIISELKINELYDDIIRKQIFFYYLYDKNEEIITSARKEQLTEIAKHIKNDDLSSVILFTRETINHTELVNVKIPTQYQEDWLLKRILIVYFFKNAYLGSCEVIKSIFSENDYDFFTDILYSFIRERELIQRDKTLENEKDVKKIFDKIWSRKDDYILCTKDIQRIFYIFCLESTLYSCPDQSNIVLSSVPDVLKSDDKIKEYELMIKIQKGEAKFEEIVSLCKKKNSFWILYNFLISIKDNNQKITLIEKEPDILLMDSNIYFIYISALRCTGQIKKANRIFTRYFEKYKEYAECWIEGVYLRNENVSIDALENKWLQGEIKSNSPKVNYLVAEIIFKDGRIDSCMEILDVLETRGQSSILTKKLKVGCYLAKNEKLHALQILKELIGNNKNDYFIVINYLILCWELKRTVDNEILDAALVFNDSLAYLVVANFYERDKKVKDVKPYFIKSLLLNKGQNDKIYGQYWFRFLNENKLEKKVDCVNLDTAIYLKSKTSEEEKIYCVCDKSVLPEENYLWNNSKFISYETAAKNMWLRKRVGDSIRIENDEYLINNIIHIDYYYADICRKKVFESEYAKLITIPSGTDEKDFLEEFKKSLKAELGENNQVNELIDSYKDLNNIPFPLYKISAFSKLEYEQLVYYLIKDSEIILRENFHGNQTEESLINKGFILSFSSLILLFLLDIDVSLLNKNNVFISSSTFMEINNQKDKLLQEYNKDTVATIGFNNDDLILNESTEDEKNEWMSFAVGLFEYANKLSKIENDCSLDTEQISEDDIIQLIGISDYDSLAICKNYEYSFVNFEIFAETMTILPDVKVNNVDILQFLDTIVDDDILLLNTVKKLIDFQSPNIISLDLVKRIILSTYDLDEAWKQYLEKISENKGEYRKLLCQEVSIVGKQAVEQDIGIHNSRFLSFVNLCMKLNCIKIGYRWNNGNIELVSYRYQNDLNNETDE